jgi:hypothetical protein
MALQLTSIHPRPIRKVDICWRLANFLFQPHTPAPPIPFPTKVAPMALSLSLRPDSGHRNSDNSANDVEDDDGLNQSARPSQTPLKSIWQNVSDILFHNH